MSHYSAVVACKVGIKKGSLQTGQQFAWGLLLVSLQEWPQTAGIHRKIMVFLIISPPFPSPFLPSSPLFFQVSKAFEADFFCYANFKSIFSKVWLQ